VLTSFTQRQECFKQRKGIAELPAPPARQEVAAATSLAALESKFGKLLREAKQYA